MEKKHNHYVFTGDGSKETLQRLLRWVNFMPLLGFSDIGEERIYYSEPYKMNDDFVTRGLPQKPAYRLLNSDLNDTDNSPCAGYHQEGDKWIAFDHTTNDCFVEEFSTEEEARMFAYGFD